MMKAIILILAITVSWVRVSAVTYKTTLKTFTDCIAT